MKDLLLKLNGLTGMTFYLCGVADKKMYTIHDRAVFDADTPEWMQKFIAGGSNVLVFEQKDQRKQYFRWNLDENNVVAILDDTSYGSLTKILNKMLFNLRDGAGSTENASSAELKTVNDKLMGVQRRLETALKEKKAADDSVAKLTTQVASLTEQNKDQAVRLQDALSKNLELSHEAKQAQIDLSEGSKARSSVTLLRDENGRLQGQVKLLEERYQKLSEAFDALKSGKPAAEGEESVESERSKGLTKLINALNTITATGSADALDLKKLAMFVHVPNKAELERNPNAVKAIISKLLGMERSGQLTAFQMKKLNEVVL